jgi:hypothetical protein
LIDALYNLRTTRDSTHPSQEFSTFIDTAMFRTEETSTSSERFSGLMSPSKLFARHSQILSSESYGHLQLSDQKYLG